MCGCVYVCLPSRSHAVPRDRSLSRLQLSPLASSVVVILRLSDILPYCAPPSTSLSLSPALRWVLYSSLSWSPNACPNKERANWYPTNRTPPPFHEYSSFPKKSQNSEGKEFFNRVEWGLLNVLFSEQRVCHHNTEPDLLSHFFSHQFSYWNFNVNDIPHLSCPVNPPVMSCRSQDNEQLSGIIHHSSPYFVLITQEHQGRLKLVIFC